MRHVEKDDRRMRDEAWSRYWWEEKIKARADPVKYIEEKLGVGRRQAKRILKQVENDRQQVLPDPEGTKADR